MLTKIAPQNCTRCGRLIDWFKGFWWDEGDDLMCPDGEEMRRGQLPESN